MEFFNDFCKDVYSVDFKHVMPGALAHFGGNNIKASNIFFSNFGEDPWKHAGVLRDLGNDLVAEYHSCENCSHMADAFPLDPKTPEPVKWARFIGTTLIGEWTEAHYKRIVA